MYKLAKPIQVWLVNSKMPCCDYYDDDDEKVYCRYCYHGLREYVLHNNPDKNFFFDISSSVPLSLINENMDLPWNWFSVSYNIGNDDMWFLEKNLDKPFNWTDMVLFNHSLSLQSIKNNLHFPWDLEAVKDIYELSDSDMDSLHKRK